MSAPRATGAPTTGALHTMCRKTKLCKYFAHGWCARQGKCDYAHSAQEIRPTPNLACTKVCPQQQRTGRCDRVGCTFAHERSEMRKIRILRNGQASEQVPGAQPKMRAGTLARVLAEHKDNDLSTAAGFSCRQLQRSPSNMESSESEPTPVVPLPPPVPAPPTNEPGGGLFRKTVLCHFYRQGRCDRGSLCRFAHGRSELKAQPDLSRTKLCSNVFLHGGCPDPHCRYAHSSADLRGAEGHKTPAAAAASSGEEEPNEILPEKAVSPSLGELGVFVKNTFLTVETLAPTSAMRSRSEPRTMMSKMREGQRAEGDSVSSAGNSTEDMEDGTTSEASAESKKNPASPTTDITSPVSSFTETFSFHPDEEIVAIGERVRVTVKNTFLTVEEEGVGSSCLPVSRALSAPDVLSKIIRLQGLETEDVADTESTTSEVESSSSRGVDLDFVHQPVDLPTGLHEMLLGLHTAEVPCCAVQRVEKLEEATGVEEVDRYCILPAGKKVLNPRAYATAVIGGHA